MAGGKQDGVNNDDVFNDKCPICNCKIVQGVKCIKCSLRIHSKKCAKLEETDNIEDFVCEICLQNGHNLSQKTVIDVETEGNLRLEIKYLKELLSEKSLTIKNQEITINSLQSQVNLLHKVLDQNAGNNQDLPSMKQRSNHGHQSEVRLQATQKPLPSTPSDNKNAQKKVVPSSNNTRPVQKISNNDHDTKQEDPFIEVKSRKHRRSNKPIVGTNDNRVDQLIKPADTKAFLHVYKLHPSTTTQNMIDFLKPIFPDVEVSKLDSRYPEYYSSFKVTVKETMLAAATSPTLWPKGTCVNRFFHRKTTSAKIL